LSEGRKAPVRVPTERGVRSFAVGLFAFLLFVGPWMGLAGLLWLKAQQMKPL
jgi:hypothetical protein